MIYGSRIIGRADSPIGLGMVPKAKRQIIQVLDALIERNKLMRRIGALEA